VFSGGNGAVGTYENVIAKADACSILNDKVVVSIKEIPYGDVISVIAPKRWDENNLFSHFAKQFEKNCVLLFSVIWRELIVAVAFILADANLLLVCGIVAPLEKAICWNNWFFAHKRTPFSIVWNNERQECAKERTPAHKTTRKWYITGFG
jgi:hypothetical protein